MSYYYYEDSSHYCYTAPTHYEDTSTPYDPHIYGNSPSDPVYYNEPPSEPIYYNDIAPDVVHYVETPSYDELEAYAEAAPNRTYTEDEIHPAYRDHPDNRLHYDEPPLVELYHEDEVHPAYRDNPVDDDHMDLHTAPPDIEIHQAYRNHEDSTNPELNHEERIWEEYTWIPYKSNGVTVYRPPYDKTFYTPSSHDNAPSWDLEQSIGLIGSFVDNHRKRVTEEPNNLRRIEKWSPRVNQLMSVSQHMEAILARRRTESSVEDETGEVYEDGNDVYIPDPPPASPYIQDTFPSYHNFDDNTLLTSPPDICIPDPLPLSPNIWFKPTHLKSTFLITASQRREPRYYFAPIRRRRQPNPRNKTRTSSPPDIRTPKPHPISPNIQTHRPHFHSPTNRHPPDTLPPKPIPPKPNISTQLPVFQQPRCPSYMRPRRKHPPHSSKRTHPLIPHHHHNVKRRILKKSCLALDVRGRTSLGGG